MDKSRKSTHSDRAPEAGPSQRPAQVRTRKEPQKPGPPDDPNQYKPKAIRTAAALIWKETQFPIPPPKDLLQGVRRVDLSGSGVTDVSWLEGMGVTWLSVNGCRLSDWKVVGGLSELSVLNINDCGLTSLPKSLKSLGKLKAVVAMNNEWTELDDKVVSSWKELNSLIVSHSPNLTTLPKMTNLNHMAKLTFSHCPKLTIDSLPDLTSLPLLRDVRMNNLPLLTGLPGHLATWGTGPMSLVGKTESGDGLEGLDIGNCSLPFEAVSRLFLTPTKTPKWPHLRSLSLHSNPLALTHPTYPALLQASKNLSNLQIIDAKRVVERKGKGMVQETRRDKARRAKVKPTGANVSVEGKMRSWGKSEDANEEPKAKRAKGDDVKTADDGLVPKKRKADDAAPKSKRAKTDVIPSAPDTKVGHKNKSESRKHRTAAPQPIVEPKTITKADPTVLVAAPKRPTQSDTSVLKVVEVEGKRHNGVDLKEMFKKTEVEGSGLGVGGW